jgi:hypothetical protein
MGFKSLRTIGFFVGCVWLFTLAVALSFTQSDWGFGPDAGMPLLILGLASGLLLGCRASIVLLVCYPTTLPFLPLHLFFTYRHPNPFSKCIQFDKGGQVEKTPANRRKKQIARVLLFPAIP